MEAKVQFTIRTDEPMVSFPVSVPRDGYRGNDPRRRRKQQRHNEVARECEEYLNRKIAEDAAETQVYHYSSIARDLNLFLEDVRNVLFAVDCGHNGLTVRKSSPSAGPGVRP
jgi:hypothetical protein